MVRDWHESFQSGEDAMMIAKRNAEVAKLNELAREVRRQEGRLGAEEIEVGEAIFAAGDRVITRVNDKRAEVFNRERWEIADVGAQRERVVLEGIDQAKRDELGREYLSQTNPYSDAPALEHAYAVTTYSAQGSTVDRAFVVADPSMDKQEMYVATSRSRGETQLYTTPEIQTHREEIAPTSPYQREGIPHIAEVAERDRAQLAAHEVSLRSRFEGLPTSELAARHRELESAAFHEEGNQRVYDRLAERIEQVRARRRERENEATQLAQVRCPDREELRWQEVMERQSRRELERLGQRPSDPTKQKVWDRAIADIESFRLRNGVNDPKRALGREVERSVQRSASGRPSGRFARPTGSLGAASSRLRDAAWSEQDSASAGKPRPTFD